MQLSQPMPISVMIEWRPRTGGCSADHLCYLVGRCAEAKLVSFGSRRGTDTWYMFGPRSLNHVGYQADTGIPVSPPKDQGFV